MSLGRGGERLPPSLPAILKNKTRRKSPGKGQSTRAELGGEFQDSTTLLTTLKSLSSTFLLVIIGLLDNKE